MAKIRRNTKREMPALNTSSLPDIIFMLLFFFMSVTSMKEVGYKVSITPPQASELSKLEKKSLIRYVYVGKEIGKEKVPNAVSRIQLDDQFAEHTDICNYFVQERNAMSDEDRNQMRVLIKADKDTHMDILSKIKMGLRQASALRISYAAKDSQPAK